MKLAVMLITCVALTGTMFAKSSDTMRQEVEKEFQVFPKCKTHEDVMDRLIYISNAMITVMAEYKGKGSIEETSGKLKGLDDAILSAAEDARKLDAPTEEDKENYKTRFMANKVNSHARVMTAMESLSRLDPQSQQAFKMLLMNSNDKAMAAHAEMQGMYVDEEWLKSHKLSIVF